MLGIAARELHLKIGLFGNGKDPSGSWAALQLCRVKVRFSPVTRPPLRCGATGLSPRP